MADRNKHKYLASLAVAGLSLAIAASIAFLPIVTHADSPNQVGLVVRFGDGETFTDCVEFEEEQINGLEVLSKAGLSTIYDVAGGLGSAVCKIENEGCDFPAEDCFCQCAGGANCVYWTYWHLKDGTWEYSQAGAGGYYVSDGDVEGWAWAAELPQVAFHDICVPPPTATSTDTATPEPTPTPTDTPEPTPMPTKTVEPTNTPRPPTIAYFSADRSTINAGESTTLTWDLSDAKAAYLRYENTEEGVVAPGSKMVSPATTTVYTLIARNDGGETTVQLTINVIPVTDTPVATATPPVPDTPTPTAAHLPSATPLPTSPPSGDPSVTPTAEQPSPPPTDTPGPSPTALATGTPLPPPSPRPTLTPSVSSTPAPVAAVTPAPDVQMRPTPHNLSRDVPDEPGSPIPAAVLGMVGVIALLGGLAGLVIMVVILLGYGKES